MTVQDMIRRLEKIDKDKMCIHKFKANDKGWSNVDIQEGKNYVYIVADTNLPFDD